MQEVEKIVVCDECKKRYTQHYTIGDATVDFKVRFDSGGCFYKGKQLCDECCKKIELKLKQNPLKGG